MSLISNWICELVNWSLFLPTRTTEAANNLINSTHFLLAADDDDDDDDDYDDSDDADNDDEAGNDDDDFNDERLAQQITWLIQLIPFLFLPSAFYPL